MGNSRADDRRTRIRRTMIQAGLSRVAAAVLASAGLNEARADASGTTADDYPNRPIRLLVPFPPGSGTDTSARFYGRKLSELTGQPVVIDNRAGGNGFIAVQAVTSAPPDGYTLFIGSNSTLATNVALFRKMPYDPVRDLSPISTLVQNAVVLIVPPGSPYRTLQDLVAAAKAAPGKLNYAGGSAGYQLMAELLCQQTGIRMTYVPYRGAPGSVTAVAAGEVDFSVVDVSAALELARGGKLRMLALADGKRSAVLPDVPTTSEAGAPQFTAYTWVAAMAPNGTPQPVLDKLSALFATIGDMPETRQFYASQGTAPAPAGPQYMRRFQLEEIDRWKRIATDAKVELQ